MINKSIILILSVLFIYSPIFNGKLLWDDDNEIENNFALRSSNGLKNIWIGDQASGADYLPIKTTIQWIEWHIWRDNLTFYHLANILFHLMGCLLIWILLWRLGMRQGAWLSALIFSIHPIAVETVAWISEQKNTISLCLILLAMHTWISFKDKKNNIYYIASLVLFILALLSKSSVIMFPVILLLYGSYESLKLPENQFLQRKELQLNNFLESIPFFIISLIFAYITIYFQKERAIGSEYIPIGDLGSRLAIASQATFFYLSKILFPFHLLPIYPRWPIQPPTNVQILSFTFLFIVFLWIWEKRFTYGRPLLLGFGFFLINMIPIMGFFKMSFMRITWVSDHLIYFPFLGISALLGSGISKLYGLGRHKNFLLTLGCLLFSLAIFKSHSYSAIFFNEYALWTYTLKYNPNAWQAHSRLGKVLMDNKDYCNAYYHIKKAYQLRPDLSETNNNYGIMLLKFNKINESIVHLKKASEITPGHIFLFNLSQAYIQNKDFKNALNVYMEILKFEPNNVIILYNSSVILNQLGFKIWARENLERATKLNPNFKEAIINLNKLK